MQEKFNKKQVCSFLSTFGEEKHSRMISIYISGYENHYEKCSSALQNKDSQSLQASVHDVKSISYTLGAEELGKLAEETEMKLKEENAPDAYKAVPTILDEITHIISVLKTELEKLQSS